MDGIAAHSNAVDGASVGKKDNMAKPDANNRRVIWLFAADSMALRRDVLKKFGSNRVLVVLPESGGKLVVGHVMKGKSRKNAAHHMSVLQSTAGEQWLLSLADYHIFGVTGKLASFCLPWPWQPQHTALVVP